MTYIKKKCVRLNAKFYQDLVFEKGIKAALEKLSADMGSSLDVTKSRSNDDKQRIVCTVKLKDVFTIGSTNKIPVQATFYSGNESEIETCASLRLADKLFINPDKHVPVLYLAPTSNFHIY